MKKIELVLQSEESLKVLSRPEGVESVRIRLRENEDGTYTLQALIVRDSEQWREIVERGAGVRGDPEDDWGGKRE